MCARACRRCGACAVCVCNDVCSVVYSPRCPRSADVRVSARVQSVQRVPLARRESRSLQYLTLHLPACSLPASRTRASSLMRNAFFFLFLSAAYRKQRKVSALRRTVLAFVCEACERVVPPRRSRHFCRKVAFELKWETVACTHTLSFCSTVEAAVHFSQ